ncbi:MAG: ADP-forming succinate--CoA ligase subunit beta [Lentisphaeria bacterium]|nr:ADP-forming succinate--CoA ligase subunit beta [Lentisphaeria bacterium]
MKIHEYQAKDILAKYGVPVQSGVVIEDKAEATAAIKSVQDRTGVEATVVKAQIHAGGRGKGGGVKYSPTTADAVENVNNILGMTLITPQTGPEGQFVRKVYITEALDIASEYYLAVLLDRANECPVIIASSEGGMEIEEVAHSNPDAIIKEYVDPTVGLQGFQLRRLVKRLGLSGAHAKQAMKLIYNLYTCYSETDASLCEINPLVITDSDEVIALDAKFDFDESALYRQKAIAELRDEYEEPPAEVEAAKYNLNYVKLDGNVGCMVNGAGLAMGTMDIIKLKGSEPANFLDVGGTANPETVKNGFRIILADPNVKAVLINIFGGIVRCDRIANGVVQAVKELDLNVPVVVRLQGTNAQEAKEILAESGVDIIAADSLDDAAEKVVAAAQ